MSPLTEAELDAELLDRLFADYAEAATVLGVQVRGTGGLVRVDLAEARRQFSSGRVGALQVQYRHAGREWRDTLLRRDGGARLVRAEVGDGPPGAA